MKVKIAKWGNSLALRLPKGLAEDAGLKQGQTVDLVATDRGIELRPVARKVTLAELLAQIEPGTPPPPSVDWSAAETPWPDDDWSDLAPTEEEMGSSDDRRRRKRS